MMRFVKQLAPVLSLAVVGIGAVAEAAGATDYAHCQKSADGSGSCRGNMREFRNYTGGPSYAEFGMNSSGTKVFYASYTPAGGATEHFSCTPNATVAAVWEQAMQNIGYFYVTWDTTGACNYIWFYNGSRHFNY
jgi:hypothetical protein